MGQIDEYALQQFGRLEEAMQDSLNIIMDAIRETTATIEQAKRHIGQ